MNSKKKIGLWSLVMLTFVPTFGFNNITSNAVALGPAAIPSWLIVSLLYFLPLSIMIAELASANQDKEGGIYTWINSSIGPNWAFIGTWSYFVANLFYLQMVFARIPVMVSWALFGENRFTNPAMLVYLSLVLVIVLTYIATLGVKMFSKISDIGGKLTLATTVIFIVFAIVGVIIGKTPYATTFTAKTIIPQFNASYFSTFSWLLLAVAGSEVAGTYIKDVDNPRKTFPKGVIIATIFIALAYIIGSLAVCFVASPEVLTKAGLKDAGYIVYKILAHNWGLGSGKVAVQLYALIYTITSIAAYVVWMESPLRAMFSEVPEDIFPKFITKKREDGTMVNALWIQCAVLIVLIAVPLVGLKGINDFFVLLTNLSSLSLVIPYIVLGAAYLAFRMRGNHAPFEMLKSKSIVIIASGIVLILGIFAFFGAGWGDFVDAKSFGEAIIPILKDYGGPVLLIIVGFIITRITSAITPTKINN